MKRALVLLWPVLLLLGACDKSAPVITGTLDAAVLAERVRGAHLHRHLTQSPATLDPSLNEDVAGYAVTDDLFEGLVRLDAAGNTVPGVAERWEVSADGLLWRFFLRPQARWSNGDPVVAADFVFAWRRALDPQTASANAQQLLPLAGAAEIISGKALPEALAAKSIAAHTLEVRLVAPTPYFLYLLANSWLMPLHAATVRAHGARWTDPANFVGNGAFMLDSRTINGPIELRRNPLYWDAQSVQLTAVTYHPVTDTAAATARFLAGDLDVTDRFQVEDIDWLKAALGSQLRLEPSFATYMLGMQVDRPPFDDVRLRRAMVMALDREILTSRLLKGLYLPAYGIVPPLPGYNAVLPEWARMSPSERKFEAQRLYAQAGYSKEKPLEVQLWYPTADAGTRRMLEGMAAMWRVNLGAVVRLANEEWKVHQQNRHIRKHHLFFYPWSGDYPDPVTFLSLPMTGSIQNYMDYRSASYDAAVRAAQSSTQSQARQAAYHEAERILYNDAVIVPVYYYQSRHLVRAHVRGWQGNPMDRHVSRNLSLAAAGP